MFNLLKYSSIILTMLVTIGPALANRQPFFDDPESPHPYLDTESPQWKEATAIKLPAYPEPANLVEFFVDIPNPRFRYFIDSRSLTINPDDRAIRYTLVMQSVSGGANNVTYEGLRCDANKYKIYAYGNSLQNFSRLNNPQWQHIKRTSPYPQHRELREILFCDSNLGYEPKAVAAIISSLKNSHRITGTSLF